MRQDESDAFELMLRSAKLPAPPGALKSRVEEIRAHAGHGAAEPQASAQRTALRTLLLLAACALLGVLYSLNSSKRVTPHQQSKPDANLLACRFADADDFRAKARVAAIIGDTAILEHLDTGKQGIVRKGSIIAGYEVLSISEDGIELQSTSDETDVFTIKVQSGNGAAPVGSEQLNDIDNSADSRATGFDESMSYYLKNAPKVSAFTLSGTVRDVYGKPMAGIAVTVIHQPAGHIAIGATITDEQGRYEVVGLEYEASYLLLIINDNRIDISGHWKNTTTVDIDLQALGFFEIKGKIVGSESPAKYAVWGKGQNYCTSQIYASESFTLLAQQEIDSINVIASSPTSNLRLKKKGPWNSNVELTIDIAEEKKSFHNYYGNVSGLNGQPLDGAQITTVTQSAATSVCTVGEDGRYSLDVQDKADWIGVNADGIAAIVQIDPENPNINIDLKNLELTKYHGRVTLDGSTPVKGMAVHLAATYTSAMTTTDENGGWTLHTNATFISLKIFGDGVSLHYAAASKDRLVSNIAADTFTISGSVADANNHPVVNARIDAWDQAQRWPSLGQTFTDENGKFTFKTNVPVQFLTVNGCSPFFQGPWDKDIAVELKLP